MNKTFAYTSIVLALLSGCSTTKKQEAQAPSAPIANVSQGKTPSAMEVDPKLTSTFKRKGIKVEWNQKELLAIEATGYATTMGNSFTNREVAYRIAEMDAKAKLRRFIIEDVSTETVVTTFSRNVEKAKDKAKTYTAGTDVEMSEDEAMREANSLTSETSSRVARNMTKTIRNSASGILRGVATVDEQVIDKQTVSVTIRWDVNSDTVAQHLRMRFGN